MATETEDSATDATSPAPYSPQAGNAGLTLPPPSQGLPIGAPSGIGVPMRGPAAPPPLPQTPQPDFNVIAQQIARQQQLANNPLYALGQGFQGQNAQAGVLQQQMQLAQMIQQQRQSALQERQQGQQALSNHVGLITKIAEAKQQGLLSDDAIDALAPLLEQQQAQMFSEGSSLNGQAIPPQPGELAKMLKSGGSAIRDYIDGQQDALPGDMQRAVVMEARKPGSGAEFLQKRRAERIANMAPTIEGHVRTLVGNLQQQMGGGTPTYAQVMDAVDAELKNQPDDVLAKEFGGEKRDFIAKAVQQALKSDSPFIKGLNVQVGPGEVKGMGDASAYLAPAITQLQAKYPSLRGVTPETLGQQSADIATEVKSLATQMMQRGKGDIAQQTGLGQVRAKQDEPLMYGDPKGHWIAKDSGAPVNPIYTSANQLVAQGEGKYARIEDGPDWQSYVASQNIKRTISELIPYAEQLSRKPGGNWANAIEYWANEKAGGPVDPGLSMRSYAIAQLAQIKAETGSSRITTSEQQLLAIMPKATDSAARALEKLRIWNKMNQTIEDIHLGKAQPNDLDSQIAAAQGRLRDMDAQDAKGKLQPGEKLIVGPDGNPVVLQKGMPMPKGYRPY